MAVERVHLFAALLAVIALGSAYALPSSRIIDGEEAKVGEFPWVVSVRVDNSHVGVGSIISENFILTAAHIVTNTAPERISVRVGSTNQYAGGQIVLVSGHAEHPSFGNFLHDICLLKLEKSLTFSNTIAKIALPALNEEVPEEEHATVAGWGLMLNGVTPYKLQHTKMAALSPENCELEAGFGYAMSLCLKHAEHQGYCRGDYGAGAVVDNKLVGIASFAFGSCGTKYPDVAVRVSYYIDWIEANIA